MIKFNSGALQDNRTESEQMRDYSHYEVKAMFSPVNWVEKITLKKYPIRFQNGAGSCVAHTAAKLLSIDNQLEEGRWIEFSPKDIYTRRINKDTPGMMSYDVMDIIRKQGATLEEFIPSDNQSEQDINIIERKPSDILIGKVFRSSGSITIPKNIDEVASVLETGKGVMTWFRFNIDEWTDTPVVNSENPVNAHSVTAVDYTLINGKRCLIIDDSWGKTYGLNGQRIITEDFFNARNFFNGYLLDLTNGVGGQVVNFTFNKDLKFGDRNSDVSELQNKLKTLGFFPDIPITDFYGGITANSVKKWQIQYNIDTLEELNKLQGMYFGPKSRAKMNLI